MADVSKLSITQASLLDAPKETLMTVISYRPFKISCYFVSQARNFTPKEHEMFDW